jgi:hypothetical protein
MANADADRVMAFVRSAKARAVDDETVVALLRQGGWSERRVYAALATYYEDTLGCAVPQRGSNAEYAREAFLYLVSFIALGIWAYALGHLCFALIDRAFPDVLSYESSFRDNASYSLASLIVGFPLYLVVMAMIGRIDANRPEALDSGVRTWLTYAALVIATLIVVGDVVWFLGTFLSGSLTARFVLQSLAIVAIAGSIFWYYLETVRRRARNAAKSRAFGAAATLAVLAAVIGGFMQYGSPALQRSKSADDLRVERLESIQAAMHDRYASAMPSSSFTMPRTLADLGAGVHTTDAVTQRPFEYITLGGTRYQLCTTFETPSDAGTLSDSWMHSTGRTCFTRDAAVDR